MTLSRPRAFCAAALLAAFIPALPASAGYFTLTSGDSLATIDSDSDYGIDNLSSANVDHLFQHWFWYRLGASSPEIPITTGTMTVLSENQSASNELNLAYSSTNFHAHIDIILHDDPLGANTVGCTSSILISNISSTATLDFHLFAYTDFDLNDSIDDAWVQITSNGAAQAIAGIVSRETLTPAADSFGVDTYPRLVNTLNDGFPTNLNNSTSLGPADNTYAHQWNRTLGPGSTLLVNIEMEVTPKTNFNLRASTAAGGAHRLAWGSTPVEFYTVQSRTNLLTGNWINVPSMTNMTGGVGATEVTINTNVPSIFYRVLNVTP